MNLRIKVRRESCGIIILILISFPFSLYLEFHRNININCMKADSLRNENIEKFSLSNAPFGSNSYMDIQWKQIENNSKEQSLNEHITDTNGSSIIIGSEGSEGDDIDFNKDNNRIDNYLWILRKNHITNPTDANRRQYIAKGKVASLALEYGYAPRFWSFKAQLRFNEIRQTNGYTVLPGDTVMIQADKNAQVDITHFLGGK